LFTPIRLTAVACYASGPLKVRSQNVAPPPPKPLHKHQYVCRHLVTVHFSQLTYTVLTLLVLIIPCSGVQCGLKYQHWPMKRNLFLTRKVVSGILYPHNSNKSNPQKSKIPTNIDVYSYRRAHRPASCSAGVICRGCWVVTCNTQPSNY
jgi:hypothetical protein